MLLFSYCFLTIVISDLELILAFIHVILNSLVEHPFILYILKLQAYLWNISALVPLNKLIALWGPFLIVLWRIQSLFEVIFQDIYTILRLEVYLRSIVSGLPISGNFIPKKRGFFWNTSCYSWVSGPKSFWMRYNWSTSFSPGKRGFPSVSSQSKQPIAHKSTPFP